MSSTLNPDNDFPRQGGSSRPGSTTGALGPGDSSDSGSDMAGARRHDFDRDTELDNHALETGDTELDSDTDRSGTGERASADGDGTLRFDSDIEPDRAGGMLASADESGLPDDMPDPDEDEPL